MGSVHISKMYLRYDVVMFDDRIIHPTILVKVRKAILHNADHNPINLFLLCSIRYITTRVFYMPII